MDHDGELLTKSWHDLSAAFMTPVSSPVNTLVVGPGNYRFADFQRISLSFAVICMAASVILVPLVLPF